MTSPFILRCSRESLQAAESLVAVQYFNCIKNGVEVERHFRCQQQDNGCVNQWDVLYDNSFLL